MKRMLCVMLCFGVLLTACGTAGNAAKTDNSQPTPAVSGTEDVAKNEADATSTTDEVGEAEASQALEPVELVVYHLGDGAVDNQEVFDLINQKTSELINTTIKPQFISWAEFDTKYPLVFASGEQFDIIYTSSWSHYADQSMRGSFYELTDDLLNQYAPELMAVMPEDALRQARINNKVYMLPNINDEWNHLGLLVRGDLRKKYNVPEINSLENLELYLKALAENESSIIPFDGGSDFDQWVSPSLWLLQPNGWVIMDALPGYAYRLDDPSGKLFAMADTQEYKDYLSKMREYNELGFWSKNALNNPTRNDDSFNNGRSGLAVHNIGTITAAWQEANKNHPEWEAEVYDSMFGKYTTIPTSYLGNGMALRATTKHPERAIMYINLIRSNQELYDLTMNGIEGKHWIDAGPGKSAAGPNFGDYGGYSNWGFITRNLRRFSVDEWPGLQDVYKSYEARAVSNPAYYFLFDDSEVKNEIAAMSNIKERYEKTLNFGFEANWEATIADVQKQYEVAGRPAVLAEYEKQLAAYLNTYNK